MDDLLVYRHDAEKFLLVVNASNIEKKDWNHIQAYNERFGAEMHNASDAYCLFAVQGPKVASFLQGLTEVKLDEIAYYHFRVGKLAGIDEESSSATRDTPVRVVLSCTRKTNTPKPCGTP